MLKAAFVLCVQMLQSATNRQLWATNMQKEGISDSAIAEIQSWDSLEMVKRYSDIPTEERWAQFFVGEEEENYVCKDCLMIKKRS